MPKISATYRRACITWNVPDLGASVRDRVATIKSLPHLRYAIFQLESAPTTGQKHFQIYAEFKQPNRRAAIQRVLSGAHIEHPAGSLKQNQDYCSKEDSRVEGPWSVGEPLPQDPERQTGQGSRVDIGEFKEAIKSRKTDAELWDLYPDLMARYPRMADSVRSAFYGRRDGPPEVHLYYGDAGTGKSRLAHELAPDAYKKVPGMWWDLYRGESDVIMDDFYGIADYPYALFLQLTDRYNYTAQIKGGMARVNPKRIFITSNMDPRDWYRSVSGYDAHAFFRRVTKILEFRKDCETVEHNPTDFANY